MINISEYTCHKCGKVFPVLNKGLWKYKKMNKVTKKTMVFCSWGCLREWETGKRKENKHEF